jgi:plasmid replication initiation protein
MKKTNISKIFIPKTLKVYKNKKLNNANFSDFTLTDYQVYLHLVSKVGGVDECGKYLQPEQLQRQYTLTAKEFSESFNADLSHSYKLLSKACKKLMKTSITFYKPEIKEIREINICAEATYKLQEGMIEIKFTDSIMPYLAQVTERFVLYNLKEIANFGSLYTTRLYELLQDFKTTGWMLKSVEELRYTFATGNKFKAYKDFKKYTFAHACQEINDNYDMELRFEEIKKGRKIVEVKFFFKPTKVIQRLDKNRQVHNTYISPIAIIKPLKPKIVKSSKKINKLIDITPELDSSQEKKIKPKNIFISLFDKIKSSKFKS